MVSRGQLAARSARYGRGLSGASAKPLAIVTTIHVAMGRPLDDVVSDHGRKHHGNQEQRVLFKQAHLTTPSRYRRRWLTISGPASPARHLSVTVLSNSAGGNSLDCIPLQDREDASLSGFLPQRRRASGGCISRPASRTRLVGGALLGRVPRRI